jgi:hypothetical protein
MYAKVNGSALSISMCSTLPSDIYFMFRYRG